LGKHSTKTDNAFGMGGGGREAPPPKGGQKLSRGGRKREKLKGKELGRGGKKIMNQKKTERTLSTRFWKKKS